MIGELEYCLEPEAGAKYRIINNRYDGQRLLFVKLPCGVDCSDRRSHYSYLATAASFNLGAGCAVILAENHGDHLSRKYDTEIIRQCEKGHIYGIRDYRFIGGGEGATLGLSHLCRQIDFRKMLLINMPLSYRLGETVELLSDVDRRRLTFVYGDRSPSFRYTPLLRRLYADMVTVKGADQDFTGMAEEFRALYRWLL